MTWVSMLPAPREWRPIVLLDILHNAVQQKIKKNKPTQMAIVRTKIQQLTLHRFFSPHLYHNKEIYEKNNSEPTKLFALQY